MSFRRIGSRMTTKRPNINFHILAQRQLTEDSVELLRVIHLENADVRAFPDDPPDMPSNAGPLKFLGHRGLGCAQLDDLVRIRVRRDADDHLDMEQHVIRTR